MLLSVRMPLPTHQHPKEEPLSVGALCRHTYKGDLDDLCSALSILTLYSAESTSCSWNLGPSHVLSPQTKLESVMDTKEEKAAPEQILTHRYE